MALQNEFEIVAHKKLQHVNLFVNEITYRSFHFHNDFELMCVLDGEGFVSTQNQQIPLFPGNVVLMNSVEPHEITGGGQPVTVVILQVSNHFLMDYFPRIRNLVFEKHNLSGLCSAEELEPLWSSLFVLLKTYLQEQDCYELTCVSALCQIFSFLLSHVPHQILSDREYEQRKKQFHRIVRIFSYIDDNYQSPIRLADVAEQEGLTTTHLSHLFTEQYGVSFQEYLNSVRFEHCLRLIGDPSLTLTDVSEASGFSELKYMTRLFESRFGMKPKEYRQALISDFENGERPSKMQKSTPRHMNYLEYIYPDAEALAYLKTLDRFVGG